MGGGAQKNGAGEAGGGSSEAVGELDGLAGGSSAVACEAEARLLVRLKTDYPELRFRVSNKFMFRPPRTVVVEEGGEADDGWALQLLHEVGHAVLGHRDYATDPERLVMEREAWERARELCGEYNIYYDEELVEAKLDTYRDWLHQRSRCPDCGLTRYQTRDGRYHCPGCELG